MSLPQNLHYAESHEWSLLNDDGTVSVGITHHAQDALGDIVFLELPKVGAALQAKQSCAVVESVKAASDIYAPVSGEVVAINEDLASQPEQINSSPYESWFFKIAPANVEDLKSLLDANSYNALIGG
ncbi:glycine cleavage system protein GcvH [Polynucleobacter kasalickyi]|uniref:Glycine cleavage system H protein n=1 Tax=Polynucleobacter kasalickyi TaxID=1938817 RepID=A0A1W2BT72_9BURK|nr:glycine cleavage system protein GcvH [Polynucleobacter kasalickyi]SMC76089.1 glycine cleavage system H protein [Polynucleobacter kasalickyi]